MNAPPMAVVRAFGLRPEESVAAGDWTAEVMAALGEDGFRVPRPRPRLDGLGWVVDGWAAWERVPGEHRTTTADWRQALDVTVRFHEALRSAPPPPTRAERRDVFAVADRMAWGEMALPTGDRLGSALERLGRHRVEIDAPPQVVHGDVAGNLLWHADLPPAVIDLSPYWRPGGLGAAQLVVDATLWYGAGRSLLDQFLELEPARGRQLVVRGLIFRLAIDAQLDAGDVSDVRWEPAAAARDLRHAAVLAAWVTGQVPW